MIFPDTRSIPISTISAIHYVAAAVALIVALNAGAAHGDQVVVGHRSYRGAQIVGMQDALLQLRTAEGLSVGVPIETIELLIVEQSGPLDDLNEAERLVAAGELQKAVVRYERALRLASGFWTDVINARLLAAHVRLGQLDEAVLCYIRLVQSRFTGPTGAARLVPNLETVQRNARYARAVRELEAALATRPPEDQTVLFLLLRFELLRRTADRRAKDVAVGLLGMDIPSAVRSPEVYAILFSALQSGLQTQASQEGWNALDRAIENCPERNLPDFLLLKGRTLLGKAATRDEIIRASWPFMRVAIHMPDDPRAAEGLLGAARAVDRIGGHSPLKPGFAGRVDRVRALLLECMAHKAVTPAVKQEAEAMLARLDERRANP